MTMHVDVATIARGLTQGAKDRLMQPGDGDCPVVAAVQFLDHDLIRVSDDDQGWDWSERGFAVRAHLLAEGSRSAS